MKHQSPFRFTPSVLICLLSLVFALPGHAALEYKFTLDPVERDRVNLPTTAEIALPDASGEVEWSAELRASDGSARTVQVEALPAANGSLARVHWVEPFIAKGEGLEFQFTLEAGKEDSANEPEFRFEYGDDAQELFFGDRKVYRYVTAYDPDRHADTHKPYHQVYGFQGEGFITKGPGGRYDHHKGIYLGWNETRFENGDGPYDFWHSREEYQQHREFLKERTLTGPVVARSASTTDWKAPSGKATVRDTREVTTWRVAEDELVLDYVIIIQPLDGDIFLGGDAHHAGFQFRAAQEVAENEDDTVVLVPPQAEELPNDLWGNLPWAAVAFDIQGYPYTVVHMDHSEMNPEPTTYSTRPYGRFGAFFTSPVEEETPLVLKYRLLVKGTHEEEFLSPASLAARHADYLEPASVRVERQ